MYLLRLFGGVGLMDPDGRPVAGPAVQRHRVALLTLLILRPGPTSRDKLLGLLWPDRDTSTARRLLNLAVHALRKTLGREAIRSVADGLAVDHASVTSDVAQFEAALTAGDMSRAAGLYQGPLLDGFFLPAAAEFDRWADTIRARLAGRHAALIEGLAKEREAAGDWREAADWWQRLSQMDPGNGVVVRRLMLALEAQRDRAGALEQARAHTHFMAAEFGAGPDPVVAALARALADRGNGTARDAVERPEDRPLAVLPFVAVGLGDNDGGFAEGLGFELRYRLTALGIRVADPAGLARHAGPSLSVREIGAALGVAGVVEGTVRRVGDRLRATAHLVEAGHGLHLWSGAFERRTGDPFRLQEELAAEIAVGVEATWNTPGAEGLELDTRGLVLRGRFALGRRTAESLRTAVRYFSAALSRGPADPAGFCGLADAYAVMGFYDQIPPADAFGSARRAARRALSLNPGLAAPRATLAYVDLYYGWNLPLAEARFRRAITRDPRIAQAHQWYGNLLAAAGRGEEAIREMSRAVALDPQSLVASAAVGWAMYLAGRTEQAVEQCGTTLELDPNFGPAHLWQGLALQELGRWDEAILALTRARALLEGGHATAALARAIAATGDHSRAETILAGLEAGPRDYLPSYEIAKTYLALGRTEEALAWLERAAKERAHSMVFLGVDPQLAALRDSPRFRALHEQVTN